MMRAQAMMVIALLILSACGGGGSSRSLPMPSPGPSDVTPPPEDSTAFPDFEHFLAWDTATVKIPTEEQVVGGPDEEEVVSEVGGYVTLEGDTDGFLDYSVPLHGEPVTFGAETIHVNDNPRLTSTVRWQGQVAGFTPNQEVVVGDATIQFDFSTPALAGRADFTALEHYAPKAEPTGPASMWRDGSLGYEIVVRTESRFGDVFEGKVFHSTGGDEGSLNGWFVGLNHEGVRGSLIHPDLRAAFGAMSVR